MYFDSAYQTNKLLFSFLITLICMAFLAIIRNYMLKKNSEVNRKESKDQNHHSKGYESYVNKQELNNRHIDKIYTVMVMIISIPTGMIAFFLGTALSGNVIIGIICTIIFLIIMMFTFKNRILMNKI